jgi:2-iminobutanoate/2-iminopropanoate deaminase
VDECEQIMDKRIINAPDAPEAAGGYAQALLVSGATRQLFISGQIPVVRDGTVPESFAEQSRLAWRNVEAQLRAAGMTLDNLVKVTTFLSDRRYAAESRQTRSEILGDRKVALSVVIAGIFDEAWLLEIEAIAAG